MVESTNKDISKEVQQQENQEDQVEQPQRSMEEYKDFGVYQGSSEPVQVQKKHVPVFGIGHRVRIAKIYESPEEFLYKIIKVGGWARSVREGKECCFVILNDGSYQKDLQIVVDCCMEGFEEINKSKVGTSFSFVGTLVKSPKENQPYELQVSKIEKHVCKILGKCDAGKYPLSKKAHSEEFLRQIAHLRPRTNLFGAVTRVRNNLAFATHLFFQEKGFLYIHTPIITASDCEGAGQMFQVTTLLPDPKKPVGEIPTVGGKEDKADRLKEQEEEEKQLKIQQKNEQNKQKKEMGKKGKPTEQEIQAAKEKKLNAKKEAKTDEQIVKQQVQVQEEVKQEIPFDQRQIYYKKDLFGKPSFLTVSGQLNVENFCCSLTDCYTFGPTFRAENSHTTRHLAEFWMIEPELAFATLEDNMECAEAYLKFCLSYVMKNNFEELTFFDQFVEKGLIQRLQKVIDTPFKRVTYTEGVSILEEVIKNKKKKFENKVFWGVDLASEHEKYLTEVVFEGPIILYNYPKDIKSFYMKQNEDGKTVQAMDVLVPRIGEIIGGSAREEILEKLDARIDECKLDKEAYWWYRELREYGTVPHVGFGLGFERLVMMATGVENIRDVIPFPRAPGNAEF